MVFYFLTSLVYSNSIKNEFVVNWYEDEYQINDDFNRDLSLKRIEQLFLNTEVYNDHLRPQSENKLA